MRVNGKPCRHDVFTARIYQYGILHKGVLSRPVAP